MSGYIYVIRKALDEANNSPIYKVGKTTSKNPYQYLKSRYDNGFKIYNILYVEDADKYESLLLWELNRDKKFKLVEGREMIEGPIELLNMKIMNEYIKAQNDKSPEIITLDTLIRRRRMSNLDGSYTKSVNHEHCDENKTISSRELLSDEEKSQITQTHVTLPIDKIIPLKYPQCGQFICSNTGNIVTNIYIAVWGFILVEFNAGNYTFNEDIIDNDTGIYTFSRDGKIYHKFISCRVVKDEYLEENVIILNDLLLNRPLNKNELCVLGQNVEKKNITIGILDKHLSLMINDKIVYDAYFRKAELSKLWLDNGEKVIEDPTEDIVQTQFNELYYRAIDRSVIFI